MNRFLCSTATLLFFIAGSLVVMAQPEGEGHPPGQGRKPDSNDKRYFGILIVNQADTAFPWFLRRETPARERPNKRPNGGGNWRPEFSGFDTKLVRFTEAKIIPLRAGRTPLIVSYPGYRDTIGLVVAKVGRRLVVDYDRPALAHALRERLYHVSTWDTAGGAARAKAMRKITVGMPIDQARALMNIPAGTGSELPGRDVYPIDTRRSIYLEEKEGRVSKVWIAPPPVVDEMRGLGSQKTD
jgi:hypothetical protein